MYAEKAMICRFGGNESNYGLSFLLDDNAKKFAISFQPSDSMPLDRVSFKVTARTGSPTCSIRIESDSGGDPSGSLAWANATVTGVTVPAAGSWLAEAAGALTAGSTPNRNTLYHIVIANDHGTPASNNFSVTDQTAIGNLAAYGINTFVNGWTQSFNGSVWANRFSPMFVVANTAGTARMGQPFDAGGLQSLNSTTGYGVRFTSPVSGTIVGVLFSHLPNGNNDPISAKLYDIADNLLGTGTLAAGNPQGISGRHTDFIAFDDGSEAITAGQDYRLVFTDPDSLDRFEFATCPSSPDFRQVAPITQVAQWTQGSPGSWTDTLGKMPTNFGILVDTITQSGGGPTLAPYVENTDSCYV